MTDPIGKSFSFWDVEGQIIGVMKDFHFRPLHTAIEPMVLKINKQMFRRVIIKLDSENNKQALAAIETSWKDVFPGAPFEYRFIDEFYDNLYASELRMEGVFKSFSLLAIFVASLGLLGLASFIYEQKTKEIGIRKVLGASIFNILKLFSQEFIKWVLIANLLSWPVIYFVMDYWLRGFAYHTPFELWVFIASTILALLVAFCTVSFQAIKAALANPVRALRYE